MEKERVGSASLQLFTVSYKRCGGLTNTASFTALYSIKRRKFIKPARINKEVATYEVAYSVYPGVYLEFEYDYWSKRYPPRRIVITTKTVGESTSRNLGSHIIINFESEEFLTQFPQQVIDFYKARPGYHGCPGWLELSNKQYSEEENEKLLTLLRRGGVITEGAEKE